MNHCAHAFHKHLCVPGLASRGSWRACLQEASLGSCLSFPLQGTSCLGFCPVSPPSSATAPPGSLPSLDVLCCSNLGAPSPSQSLLACQPHPSHSLPSTSRSVCPLGTHSYCCLRGCLHPLSKGLICLLFAETSTAAKTETGFQGPCRGLPHSPVSIPGSLW